VEESKHAPPTPVNDASKINVFELFTDSGRRFDKHLAVASHLIEYLKDNAGYETDIFMVCHDLVELKKLADDLKAKGDKVSLRQYSMGSVAFALRLWLASGPALFESDVFATLMQIQATNRDVNGKLLCVSAVVQEQMQDEARELLSLLVDLLTIVTDHEQVTLTPASRLAKPFAPIFMRPPRRQPTAVEEKSMQLLVTDMIENADALFEMVYVSDNMADMLMAFLEAAEGGSSFGGKAAPAKKAAVTRRF